MNERIHRIHKSVGRELATRMIWVVVLATPLVIGQILVREFYH